jgi:fatty-acyl-CoA synthase
VSVLADAEHFDTPLTLTFAQLARDVHRAAAVLAELGIARGDAVAVVSVNCATMLPLLLAAEAVGIFAPINPGLSADHATELVRRSGARVVAASGPELDPTAWALARAVAQRTGARALVAMRPTAVTSEAPPLEPLDGVEVAYLEERMADADDGALPGPPPSSSDIASYLHTGGTTGTPKLAARTHSNEVSNAWMIACSDLLDQDSVTFAALPLFHTNALLVTVLAPLLKGQHVVWGGPLGYRDTSLFGNFWKIVGRHWIAGPTRLLGACAGARRRRHLEPEAADRRRRTTVARRGECVRDSDRRGAVRGLWAHGGHMRERRGWPTAQRSDTVGQRLPYQEAATVHVDEITGEWTFLPEGGVGTLVLRGPNVFAGYLAEGESGPELRPGDKLRRGRLDTGDLACIEADGFIRLAGRAKDLIIRGGHNIDPATIEDASLLAHPEVTAPAAVGWPDAHAGEVSVAFVTLARESELTPDHLLAWAASHVPERAAAPKHVEILDDIPLTAVGKQYKPELRRRAAQQAAREALAGTSVCDHVSAVLVDGSVEIHVPPSLAGDEIGNALSQFAWSWKFTS